MKKGFTLIEMLITVGLFTIIITIAVGAFANAVRTQRQVSSLISAESNISITLEEMARQIRTGYLFCNTVGGNTPGSGVPGSVAGKANADCGCTFSSAPGATAGTWTCNALDFYDAQGDRIVYERPTTGSLAWQLVESSTLSSAPQSLTGDTVSVKYLQFQLYGQTEGDHWPPRVTVSIGIAPSSTDTAVENDVVNLQTTVSARSIDCYAGGGTIQC
ncbi:MAG TPA: type II secretion system protein [Candidatus Paceibacterota bacterium]|nr:type II secretion system protein [Candidatus Paceibacterota bacterium]